MGATSAPDSRQPSVGWFRDTVTMTRAAELRARFLDQHHNPPSEPTPGILVMPNPWDIGSAKVMAVKGAVALATTSAGMAGSFGKDHQNVTRDELLDHVRALTAAVDLPFNVDAEDCFADDVDGVAETASLLAATDAAGFSIEDYDPRSASIRDVDVAAARVTAAKEAGGDLVLTARAEQHLYGDADLDDTITRLRAYRDAGADVVYAPGLTALGDIERVVIEVGVPINVLALPGTPPIPDLAAAGVSRISVGSLMAWAAYGSITGALDEIFSAGTTDYVATALSGSVRRAAFS